MAVLLLWDLTTGEQLLEMAGHADAVNAVAFNAAGDRAASGAGDDTVIVWGLPDGEQITQARYGSDVTSIAYSPTAERVAVGTQLGEVSIADTESGETLLLMGERNSIQHASQPIRALAYSDNGREIMSGGEDQLAIVWQVDTGRSLYVFDAHSAAVTGVAFDGTGRSAVSSSSDGSLYWWSLSTDSVTRIFERDRHTDEVSAITYNPGGDSLVSADLDASVFRRAVNQGRVTDTFHQTPDAQADTVYTVDFCRDGDRWVSGAGDGSLTLWADGAPAVQMTDIHTDEILSIGVQPGTEAVLAGDGAGKVVLWNPDDGTAIRILGDGEADPTHTRAVTSIAFNADGSRVLTGSVDRTVILWNVENG
jgi:WD40 repeat protein